MEKLPGDASSRQYFRIHNETDTKILAKISPDDRSTFDSFIELQHYFASLDIPVPQIFDSDADELSILQADLGDVRLYDFLQTCSSDQINKYYQQVIDLLIHFQKQTETHSEVKAYQVIFDFPKLMWEIDYTGSNLLEQFLGLTAEQISPLKNFFEDICKQIDSFPYHLIHRDFHCKNIMKSNDHLFLIDFQDARMGPISYDLVSLLNDSYFPLGEALRLQLINYYYENASKEIASFSQKFPTLNNFNHELLRVNLQRTYKVMGSFAHFYDKKGDTIFLNYLEIATHRLKDLFSSYNDSNVLPLFDEVLAKVLNKTSQLLKTKES